MCSHSIESLVSRSNRGISLAWIGESSYGMTEASLGWHSSLHITPSCQQCTLLEMLTTGSFQAIAGA